MSSRRFGQVPVNLWRESRFKALSDEAKLAVLYFWCGQQSHSAGLAIIPDQYASHDLNWPVDKWQRARTEAEASGYIVRDEETETVFVCGYLVANRPVNHPMRRAIVNQIKSIPCDRLQGLAVDALNSVEDTTPADALSGNPPNANVALLQTPYMQRQRGG